MNRPLAIALSFVLAVLFGQASLPAAVISVNFSLAGNDNNSVNTDETAVVGNPVGVPVSGTSWNNVLTHTSGNTPTTFISNSTSVNGITLNSDTALDAARLRSNIASGQAYTDFGGVTPTPLLTSLGTPGMFQSWLGILGGSEVLSITNLSSDFTTYGYTVVLYYDIGNTNRVYGHTVSDGVTSATYYTNDTNVDSDPDNDGVMLWTLATSTNSAAPTANANYSVFTGLNGSSFSITGVNNGGAGRAILNGFQIIANPVPEPSTYALFAFGSVIAWHCATKRRTAA